MRNAAPEYLDAQKSVMISSPAGSGKTEKLARRYIALLYSGSPVERILAITFTEKAAAEMKDRIIRILRDENPVFFETIKPRIPRMRISTIHSFCRKILKRFSIELGLDTDMDVADEFEAANLWRESVYEALRHDAAAENVFKRAVSSFGIKGWDKLNKALAEMHAKRILLETAFYSERNDIVGLNPTAEDLFKVYRQCLEQYRLKKRSRRLIDFNDLELMAYKAISSGTEWHNILYSFDEHTDHLLVDEFQDTSILQWKIIDKLTEEWRSGLGSKRSSGKEPTIFLVGDDKQSIYSFRGADVDIFRNTKLKLNEWLGDQYSYIEVRENFRSLPAIVDFVNDFFSKYMANDMFGDSYRRFEATRTGDGHVELIMINSAAGARENRKAEACELAKRMIELHGTTQSGTKYSYGDMALLLRKRTHLTVFEEAFKQAGVPFVVLKGIGFYSTHEVNLIRSILFFLINPSDDYSLFNLLRSRLFNIDYMVIRKLYDEFRKADASAATSLFSYMQIIYGVKSSGMPQQTELWPENKKIFLDIYEKLAGWLEMAKCTRVSIALEQLLDDSAVWRHITDRQRYLNVRKFIRIIEKMEAKSLSRAEIMDNLLVASESADESKANVNVEGMDAVRIMTIHSAKGLQFPVVFLPCLDEKPFSHGKSIDIYEQDGRIIIDDGTKDDKNNEASKNAKAKSAEEEKRLFYVASTRAMDRLYMSGVSGKSPSEKLGALVDAYGLDLPPGSCPYPLPFVFTSIDPDAESGDRSVSCAKTSRQCALDPDMQVHTARIDDDICFEQAWTDVTEEIQSMGRQGSEEWAVQGRVFHRIFELISNGTADIDNLDELVRNVLKGERLSAAWHEKIFASIMNDLSVLLKSSYYQSILMKQKSAYSELPFVLKKNRRTFRGRIDRVIIRDGIAYIYDYKTFPVAHSEMDEIASQYASQINLYRTAVEKIFSCSSKAYILFTHIPKLLEL